MARTFDELMVALGYTSYVAHGVHACKKTLHHRVMNVFLWTLRQQVTSGGANLSHDKNAFTCSDIPCFGCAFADMKSAGMCERGVLAEGY